MQEYIYGVYLNGSQVAFFLKANGQTHTVYSRGASYSDGRWYQVHVIRRLSNVTLIIMPVGAQAEFDEASFSLNRTVQLGPGSSLFFGGIHPGR